MGTLYSASPMADFNLFLQEYQSSEWTKEENKMFESALAMFDEKRPDRWLRVAEMIPGKTVIDVIKQYQYLEEDVCEIESGRFEIPAHLASAFRLELVADDRNFDANRKKSSSARGSDQERKKGIPWTEDEHRRFLMGLLKYGKGDWRNISRNYVMSKTPTQVASHAQKYFMRQHSGGKDKRRPSIHDITTNSLTSTTTPSENNRSSSDQSLRQQKFVESPKALLDWNVADDGGGMVFGSTRGNLFEPSPYDVAADGILQKLYSKAHYAAHVKPQSPMYLMQA